MTSRVVTFRVTAPALRFWDGERNNVKPLIPEEGGYSCDDFLMNLGLDDQDYFLELAGVDAPEYHWTQTAGPETGLQTVDLGEEGLALVLAEMPDGVCELAYTVTADIGEYHAETVMTVSFYETEVPETLGFERSYTLAPGETVRVAADFGGGDWQPYGVWKSIILLEESELISAETVLIEDEEGHLVEMTLDITGVQPGVTALSAEASEDGLVWRGKLIFTVLNEDGSRPDEPALAFAPVNTNRVNYKPVMPSSSGHYSMDDFVMGLNNMENADYYSALTGEDLSVSWTQTSGPEMALTLDDESLLIVGTQSAPCDLTYEVTAAYGPYSVTTTMTVHFYDCTLPYDTGFSTAYTVAVGDTLTLRSNYAGADWENSDYRGLFLMEEAPEEIVRFESHSFDDHWEDYLTVKIRSNQDGLNWDGTVTFMVVDAEGGLPDIRHILNLPADVTAVEASAFEGTRAERINVNAGCASIGARAFAECDSLLLLSLPASVTQIADDAVDGCDNLQFIIAPEGSYARAWAEAHHIALWEE